MERGSLRWNQQSDRPWRVPRQAARMLDRLAPDWDAVADCRLFAGTTPGSLDETVWRRVICEFFCVVEAFSLVHGDHACQDHLWARAKGRIGQSLADRHHQGRGPACRVVCRLGTRPRLLTQGTG